MSKKMKLMVEAAHRYALANRSDPFALRRALSHLGNGVAGMRIDEAGNKVPAYYDAKPVQVERTLPHNGQKYTVTEYCDVKVV